MWSKFRFKLAQWIIGKSGAILDARTEVVEFDGDIKPMTYGEMLGEDPTKLESPQDLWREARAQRIEEEHHGE